MTKTRTERIQAHDGGWFAGYLALPDSGSGPGLVVIQEIFGVNDYIKSTCERLAKLGYLAMAPDLFWRIEPGIAIDERSADFLPRGFGYMQKFDFQKGADDATAALEHLRGMSEVEGGRSGILGFCLGGGISYMVAALASPDVCVSYYGSAVPDALGLAAKVDCPILFQFGGSDEYLPPAKQDQVRQAFAGRPAAEFHVHEGAGHAFDNHVAPVFHHPQAATDAWKQTTEFLQRTFPA
ncbi:MAG: dienelactone hydrolase family protein [Chloroflexota bacterium]